MNSRGMAGGKKEMLEGKSRMSDGKSGTTQSQLQMTESEMELTLAQHWNAIALRLYALCNLIAVLIEMPGRAMATVHFSTVLSGGGQMSTMLTDCSAIRGESCLEEVGLPELVVRPGRMFSGMTNLHERVANVFTRFELARRTILGNQLYRKEMPSPRPSSTRKYPAVENSAAQSHGLIQSEHRAMSCSDSETSDEILLGDATRVCRFTSSNLITADLASRVSMPNATTIHTDASPDTVIVDRNRLNRELTTAELMQQSSEPRK
jgi:hypothetical protein